MTAWKISVRLSLLLLVIPGLAQTATNAPFALRDGDRVVFYGDSITAQRFYTRLAEDIVVSRYPRIRVSFYNAGVSGDTVEGGHAGNMEIRLKRDVLPWHPTVVTIMLGMNDGRYTTEYASNVKAYEAGYRELIAQLKAALPGVRLVLIRPSPYDEVGHLPTIAGYNSVMLRYGEIVSALGREENIPVVDFNQPMTTAVSKGMQIDKALAG
jgi:lysophospholipase L1-like esterase